MTKKTTKTPAAKTSKLRWSIGVFESAKNPGEMIVVYCTKAGRVSPSYAKTVRSKQAKHHMVYFGMTFAEARAKLLKVAGVKAPKASKKATPKEEIRNAA